MKMFLFVFVCSFFISYGQSFALSLSDFQGSRGNEHLETAAPLEKPSALPGLKSRNNIGKISPASNNSSFIILERILYGTIDFLLYFAGTVATVYIIYGGFLYVTSKGESDEGKTYITNAAIGLVVVIMSYAITENVIRFVLDSPIPTNPNDIQLLPEDRPDSNNPFQP